MMRLVAMVSLFPVFMPVRSVLGSDFCTCHVASPVRNEDLARSSYSYRRLYEEIDIESYRVAARDCLFLEMVETVERAAY